MAAPEPVELNFPKLPATHEKFLEYVTANAWKPMLELLEPYKQYDAELRKAFAQQPDHPAVKQPNVLPVFAGQEKHVKVRARNLEAETDQERDSYIMPLKREDRKPNGAPAIVQSLKDFQTNFAVFSESSLADLDWSNVIVAGSAVVTSLLSVPKKHTKSKRALRRYYHERLAPASDVDLFLYGLTEEQALEKIKQIERSVRDALLVETTTVRTKNAITIASQHPVRHVQIVLRLYKNISEILTGFDVDCSCAAYDGKQVYASPRATVAYMTQVNTIDLTRRSPSYENRLSKYAHRGFEIYWPGLDRSRIDPTIFERSFGRTEGLARLLILEKLPKNEDRESYLAQRRAERGRPRIYRNRYRDNKLYGNIKDEHEDEVADWLDDEVSDYHTVTVPYGPKFNARKIEKLLFTKDVLLNAEWNKPKDREVNLHRHPAFMGTANDVVGDCCGFCPEPSTVEEEEVAEEEDRKFIKGALTFMKDDPGRQAIGSFNPLDAEGWTEMAYVGNTARLCQAIVEEDVEYVVSWLEEEGNDPNTRDYTGRTPLHLAVANSTPAIVQALIDHGARMIARLVDGRTALHLAAMRGNVEMISALLRKSAANEEENEEKVDAKRAARRAAKQNEIEDTTMNDTANDKPASNADKSGEDSDSDIDMVQGSDTDMNDVTTQGSMVDIRKTKQDPEDALQADEDEDDPDVFDVNVVAWDTAVSPLHLAIVQGHTDAVKCLVSEFGADVLLPVKLFNDADKSARAAVLTLVLAMQLDLEKAQAMVSTLISLGASTAQADVKQRTVLQYCVADRPDMLNRLGELDANGVRRAINHIAANGSRYSPDVSSPLMTAIEAKDPETAIRLLVAGAKPEIDFSVYMKAIRNGRHLDAGSSKRNKETFQENVEQPVFRALEAGLPALAKRIIVDHDVEVNVIDMDGYGVLNNEYRQKYSTGHTLLDTVRAHRRALQNWQFKPKAPRKPQPMKGNDDAYLAEYTEGTYAYFAAKRQVDSARSRYKRNLERYDEEMEEAKDMKGVQEKQAAIDELVSQYNDLEKTLLDRGAETFYELHPKLEKPKAESSRRSHRFDTPDPGDFAVDLDFTLGDLTDESRERYVRLFEAAWSGNLATVKDMTMKPWKDAKGEDQPPLRVAVQDNDQLSPFAIAVLRGHQELATAIMQLALAQYVKPDPSKQRRYGIDDGDEDDDSEVPGSSEVDIQLYSEIVDDEFTREDVGEVQLQVKSQVLPLTMLQWSGSDALVDWLKAPQSSAKKIASSGFSYFGPRKSDTLAKSQARDVGGRLADAISKQYESKILSQPSNIFQLAMRNGDLDLLEYLLKLSREYLQHNNSNSDDVQPTFLELASHDYEYALEVGNPKVFVKCIQYTGAGLPIHELVERYGVEAKEKPKYYQGLTIHGRKRQDWAARGSEIATTPASQTPPLLQTIDRSSLELVEWWLSDAPMNCYEGFAQANKDDKRMQRLIEASAGFEGAARKFLKTRSHLAVHLAALAQPTVESMQVLQYLLEAMPEKLEAKNLDGLKPLHVAFATYNKGAAKLLIEAGADQFCRDSQGRNLVHLLLTQDLDRESSAGRLEAMLELIDKRLVQEMFLQRSSSWTPLAAMINSGRGRYGTDKVRKAVLDTILSYSGGKELGFINGEGDTPLHYAVRCTDVLLVNTILAHDPTLLNRENATGRTPFEMAEDRQIASMCNEPPPMPTDHDFSSRRAERYGLPSHWHEHIETKDPELFAQDKQEPETNSELQVWEIVQNTRAKLIEGGKAKRRLVTLQEANEVARRLAGRNATGMSADATTDVASDEGVETGTDEVRSLLYSRCWLNEDSIWA